MNVVVIYGFIVKTGFVSVRLYQIYRLIALMIELKKYI